MRRLALPTNKSAIALSFTLPTALLLGSALWSIERVSRDGATTAIQRSARDEARIISTSLQSELDKFSLVPLVLARDPEVRSLLAGSAQESATLNPRLEELARQTKADAIYLMDRDGLALAASNWQLDTSFIASNYGFRSYFINALREGSATQFALGSVSGTPGLYIAQRVESGGRPVGVVAVKVEFDELEASWRAATQGVFVTDRNGVVLLTSEPHWRFRTTLPDRAGIQSRNLDRRQFGAETLRPLNLATGADRGNSVEAPLLDTQQPIALDGWKLHLLIDPKPRIDAAVANGRLYLLLAVAFVCVIFAAAMIQRRRRIARAEGILAERTRMLREQLNQANRLATLGQVSAGVGHEISQPLAAVRVFAENGERLLSVGRTEDAGRNFQRIVELSERMTRITAELRRFARRDASEPKAFPLKDAIDGALLLLRDRMERLGVTLVTPVEADARVLVRAEHVRLEQVLVNLIQNALDAAGEGGTIELALGIQKEFCQLTVSDDGPGIDRDLQERMFQPFATTKADGLGLGLVIARDIMRGLGGDLTIGERVDRTEFIMRIPRA